MIRPPSACTPVTSVFSQTGTPALTSPARRPAASAWPMLSSRRLRTLLITIRPVTRAVVQMARGWEVPRLIQR